MLRTPKAGARASTHPITVLQPVAAMCAAAAASPYTISGAAGPSAATPTATAATSERSSARVRGPKPAFPSVSARRGRV
jgi:hypothetical protein